MTIYIYEIIFSNKHSDYNHYIIAERMKSKTTDHERKTSSRDAPVYAVCQCFDLLKVRIVELQKG